MFVNPQNGEVETPVLSPTFEIGSELEVPGTVVSSAEFQLPLVVVLTPYVAVVEVLPSLHTAHRCSKVFGVASPGVVVIVGLRFTFVEFIFSHVSAVVPVHVGPFDPAAARMKEIPGAVYVVAAVEVATMM